MSVAEIVALIISVGLFVGVAAWTIRDILKDDK